MRASKYLNIRIGTVDALAALKLLKHSSGRHLGEGFFVYTHTHLCAASAIARAGGGGRGLIRAGRSGDSSPDCQSS